MKREIVCGLDIGATKVSASIGEFGQDARFRLLGKARVASEGIDRGRVMEMEDSTRTIEKAMNIIRLDSGLKIGRLVLGVGGDSLKVSSYRKTLSISERGKEIKELDVHKLIESTLDTAIPFDHEVLHIFPQEFSVDGQGRIKDPRGMFGSKISVHALIISGPSSVLYNLKKCVYNAGYNVDRVVFSGLGSGFVFSKDEERISGLTFLEIGGGITTLLKFVENSPVLLEIIHFGGIDLDIIIAEALGISLPEANALKNKYGSLNMEQADHRIILDKQDKEISRLKLRQLMEPAIERLLFQIKKKIENTNDTASVGTSGIILGGGTFLLEGLVEKAEGILRIPVRLGLVRDIQNLTKDEKSLFSQASSIGIAYFDRFSRTKELSISSGGSPLQKLILRTKEIFEEYF
jgi:cell division protein FtsA